MAQATNAPTTSPREFHQAPRSAPAEVQGTDNGLCALYWAYISAAEGFRSVLDQPRVGEGAVYQLLQTEAEGLDDKAQMVVRRLEKLEATRAKDEVARVLVDWSMRTGEGLAGTMQVLATAMLITEIDHLTH